MVDLLVQDTDFAANEWKLQKTGFTSVPYTRLFSSQGKKFVRPSVIPRFTQYYSRYTINMRTPYPVLEIITKEEYRAQWFEVAMSLAHVFLLQENPSIDDMHDASVAAFDQYGVQGMDAQAAFEIQFGTRKENWIREVAKLLESKKDSAEYKSVGTTLGETDEERALFLWNRYSEQTPSTAVLEYFGIIKQIVSSKITRGAVLKVELPSFLNAKHNASSMDIVSKGSAVTYKRGILSINYEDEDKSIFTLLESWYQLSQKEDLPKTMYTSQCTVTGFNNVTNLQDTKKLVDVYPRSVGKNLLELFYTEA